MKERIRQLWDDRPLFLIIFAAAFFRILAVIFSKGYGMFDDHFLVIEASQSWVDGYDYNNWLPRSGATSAGGHGLVYPGIHYLIFSFLKWIGLNDPQGKMYVIRAIHALWSMLIVIYGYKIVEHYSGKKIARQTGLILALLWFMPMMSVRNLIEFVCIPPLVVATWMFIDPKKIGKVLPPIWAGMLCALAFDIRFQALLFVGGMGLVILFQKRWKEALLFGFAFIIAVFLTQGMIDIFIWKKPFAELTQYIKYNSENASAYVIGPWFKYIGLVAGILIPPISLFYIFGYLRSWKKYPLLFWPTFIFFVFHSAFPNKQERFIAPAIPFIIILGSIGWAEFLVTSGYWQKHDKLLKRCWVFFWTLNCIALPFLSTTYSKKNRVEAMSYLYTRKDLQSIMIEESFHDNYIQPALFYIGRWNVHVVGVTDHYPLEKAYLDYKGVKDTMVHPNYVIFYGQDKIESRVKEFTKVFPDAQYMVTITPSLVDKVMFFLNPVNKNQTTYIYRFDEKNVHLSGDTLKSGH